MKMQECVVDRLEEVGAEGNARISRQMLGDEVSRILIAQKTNTRPTHKGPLHVGKIQARLQRAWSTISPRFDYDKIPRDILCFIANQAAWLVRHGSLVVKTAMDEATAPLEGGVTTEEFERIMNLEKFLDLPVNFNEMNDKGDCMYNKVYNILSTHNTDITPQLSSKQLWLRTVLATHVIFDATYMNDRLTDDTAPRTVFEIFGMLPWLVCSWAAPENLCFVITPSANENGNNTVTCEIRTKTKSFAHRNLMAFVTSFESVQVCYDVWSLRRSTHSLTPRLVKAVKSIKKFTDTCSGGDGDYKNIVRACECVRSVLHSEDQEESVLIVNMPIRQASDISLAVENLMLAVSDVTQKMKQEFKHTSHSANATALKVSNALTKMVSAFNNAKPLNPIQIDNEDDGIVFVAAAWFVCMCADKVEVTVNFTNDKNTTMFFEEKEETDDFTYDGHENASTEKSFSTASTQAVLATLADSKLLLALLKSNGAMARMCMRVMFEEDDYLQRRTYDEWVARKKNNLNEIGVKPNNPSRVVRAVFDFRSMRRTCFIDPLYVARSKSLFETTNCERDWKLRLHLDDGVLLALHQFDTAVSYMCELASMASEEESADGGSGFYEYRGNEEDVSSESDEDVQNPREA
jgi:hypothetical protein